MEEKKPEGSGLTNTLPLAMIIAIFTGLIFTNSLPYQDERPSTRPLQTQHAGAQDVDARLWQDPFAAIESAGEESPGAKTVIVSNLNGDPAPLNFTSQRTILTSHTPKQIYKNLALVPGEEITVLAVTLPGGPYQEAAEQRMRWRYAVLSALANQDGVPQDEQHIGYFYPSSDTILQKKVPFEWWSLAKTKDKNKKILLLWLDESNLFITPVAKIRELLCETRKAKELETIEFHYAVIGPNSSSLLRDLLTETMKQNAGNPPQSNSIDQTCKDGGQNSFENEEPKIVYYSAGATASSDDLLAGIEQTDACQSITECLHKYELTLYRTTATDDAMMALLADEISLRGVKKTDKVVTLSEWDTFYGRAMCRAFQKAWQKNGREAECDYSYMRGLDGKLPAMNEKAIGNGSKKSNDNETPGDEPLIEFPEGQNQKDYLRRLANKILELDQTLKYQGNRKGVAAIGVLGSDVHDKLMILEALRQHFPHKLFFTTDLDAIYSHPAKWSHTRNMLVASAFDQNLRPELQAKIPPFRDTYQTAFFLSTQMALGRETGIVKQADIPPRLFEIGRSRPIPLPTKTDSVLLSQKESIRNDECSWDKITSCKTLQPPIVANGELRWSLMNILGVALAAILLPLVSWQIRHGIVLFLDCCPRPLVSLGSVGILLLVFYYASLSGWNDYIRRPDAEPFYWFEGVSIWPSEILRISIFLFAFGFFLWGRKRIRVMQSDLQMVGNGEEHRTFALPSEQLTAPPGHWEELFIGSWKQSSLNTHSIQPDILWTKYLGYCHNKIYGIPSSLLRVLMHGALFLVLALVLMSQSGFPNVPARGSFAISTNLFILVLAVLSTLFLTMWVVENARLCERLIFRLSEKPSQWNQNARHWAIHEKKITPECANEWLDIQLVAYLTDKMQPLIWGPMISIGLLILARSPAIDDWDMPWGLGVVFVLMLLYAVSSEIFLQQGAKSSRAKAIEQLTIKIRAMRQRENPNDRVIDHIKEEIEYIKTLRTGAFRPWYEWPLLQSFGGLGTLVIALKYLAELWKNGAF